MVSDGSRSGYPSGSGYRHLRPPHLGSSHGSSSRHSDSYHERGRRRSESSPPPSGRGLADYYLPPRAPSPPPAAPDYDPHKELDPRSSRHRDPRGYETSGGASMPRRSSAQGSSNGGGGSRISVRDMVNGKVKSWTQGYTRPTTRSVDDHARSTRRERVEREVRRGPATRHSRDDRGRAERTTKRSRSVLSSPRRYTSKEYTYYLDRKGHTVRVEVTRGSRPKDRHGSPIRRSRESPRRKARGTTRTYTTTREYTRTTSGPPLYFQDVFGGSAAAAGPGYYGDAPKSYGYSQGVRVDEPQKQRRSSLGEIVGIEECTDEEKEETPKPNNNTADEPAGLRGGHGEKMSDFTPTPTTSGIGSLHSREDDDYDDDPVPERGRVGRSDLSDVEEGIEESDPEAGMPPRAPSPPPALPNADWRRAAASQKAESDRDDGSSDQYSESEGEDPRSKAPPISGGRPKEQESVVLVKSGSSDDGYDDEGSEGSYSDGSYSGEDDGPPTPRPEPHKSPSVVGSIASGHGQLVPISDILRDHPDAAKPEGDVPRGGESPVGSNLSKHSYRSQDPAAEAKADAHSDYSDSEGSYTGGESDYTHSGDEDEGRSRGSRPPSKAGSVASNEARAPAGGGSLQNDEQYSGSDGEYQRSEYSDSESEASADEGGPPPLPQYSRPASRVPSRMSIPARSHAGSIVGVQAGGQYSGSESGSPGASPGSDVGGIPPSIRSMSRAPSRLSAASRGKGKEVVDEQGGYESEGERSDFEGGYTESEGEPPPLKHPSKTPSIIVTDLRAEDSTSPIHSDAGSISPAAGEDDQGASAPSDEEFVEEMAAQQSPISVHHMRMDTPTRRYPGPRSDATSVRSGGGYDDDIRPKATMTDGRGSAFDRRIIRSDSRQSAMRTPIRSPPAPRSVASSITAGYDDEMASQPSARYSEVGQQSIRSESRRMATPSRSYPPPAEDTASIRSPTGRSGMAIPIRPYPTPGEDAASIRSGSRRGGTATPVSRHSERVDLTEHESARYLSPAAASRISSVASSAGPGYISSARSFAPQSSREEQLEDTIVVEEAVDKGHRQHHRHRHRHHDEEADDNEETTADGQHDRHERHHRHHRHREHRHGESKRTRTEAEYSNAANDPLPQTRPRRPERNKKDRTDAGPKERRRAPHRTSSSTGKAILSSFVQSMAGPSTRRPKRKSPKTEEKYDEFPDYPRVIQVEPPDTVDGGSHDTQDVPDIPDTQDSQDAGSIPDTLGSPKMRQPRAGHSQTSKQSGSSSESARRLRAVRNANPVLSFIAGAPSISFNGESSSRHSDSTRESAGVGRRRKSSEPSFLTLWSENARSEPSNINGGMFVRKTHRRKHSDGSGGSSSKKEKTADVVNDWRPELSSVDKGKGVDRGSEEGGSSTGHGHARHPLDPVAEEGTEGEAPSSHRKHASHSHSHAQAKGIVRRPAPSRSGSFTGNLEAGVKKFFNPFGLSESSHGSRKPKGAYVVVETEVARGSKEGETHKHRHRVGEGTGEGKPREGKEHRKHRKHTEESEREHKHRHRPK